ncbi:sulfotransferase family protein [Rhodothermus bifroesti]|jgi:hypothetical protein|nr:sulfotransferase [Rhodothermus bifroesti]GBD01964.1 hypothetical protein HRbin18_01695 [bacterium HR18]
MERVPDFFIVGAAKAGTTSLYAYLKAHPQIFLPETKEPRYYAYEGERPEDFEGPGAARLIQSIIKDKATYRKLFENAASDQIIGEASPAYLYSPIAAERIAQDNPNAKIIAILRNPIERAYSHFLDNVGNGWEPCTDFEQVIQAQRRGERARWWRKWDYLGHGFYAQQLMRYMTHFPPENMKIIRYEHFRDDPERVVRDLLGFLKVDSEVELPVDQRYNVSWVPRWRWLQQVFGQPRGLKKVVRSVVPSEVRRWLRHRLEVINRHRPPMSPAARRLLLEIYLPEIEALERLLGWDLSDWKRPE